MEPITLIITQAGLDALVDAQDGSTEPIKVTHVGLTEAVFTVAPTLIALPGEFKRLATVSGQSASETVIHMTGLDDSTDVYDVRGVGLYLQDGALFAVYGQDDPLFRKVEKTTFLFVQDIAFASAVGDAIQFGDALFLNPPASETLQGVALIATQADVAAGADDTKIVTPAKMRVHLNERFADQLAPVGEAIEQEAATRQAGDASLAGEIAAIIARLDGNEFARMPIASFTEKGHVDYPIGTQIFRVNWGKKDVAAKTADTDELDEPFSICFGVFQGGGTNDPNNVDAIRAYPGTGPQAFTHVNLTNGTAGVLTLHWLAIGLA